MLADVETNSRCAVAALNVLRRELDRAECAPADRDRLHRLARMAWEHVAELLGDEPALSTPAMPSPHSSDGGGNLHQEVAAAWKHATALRRSKSPGETGFHRAQLLSIASSTSNARMRRMCREALGANAPGL
ncbi:MAG: hypothetical protein ACAH22_00050 [Tardiphaga sp.]